MAVKLLLVTSLAVLTGKGFTLPSNAAPCLSSDFSLAMRIGIGDEFVSLNAVSNGTDGTLFLVGASPSRDPGTPVTLNGESGSATLNIKIDEQHSECEDIEKGTYGISVPDLGELYGTAVPILATRGFEWPHFYYGENAIEPQRTAASQLWYACNATIQAQTYLALSWGVYNTNGSSPWGCSPTSVIRVFNIPCGSE